jgi:hypothetical protein
VRTWRERHRSRGDEPTIELGVVSEPEPDEWVVVEVEDDGPALPETERNLSEVSGRPDSNTGKDWILVRLLDDRAFCGAYLTVEVDEGKTIRVWLRSDATPGDELQWYLDLPTADDPVHRMAPSED